MELEDRLRQFIGRTVQVAVSRDEDPIEGQLVSVGEATFTLRIVPPPGYGPPSFATFIIRSVGYIRIFV
ncbi:hypothetical protein [Paludifilum halophilum]|uniref:DUF2642 domain-containing protein n=1 Tax=Paludifilum halophilum TaxID=1642702 RepID=A0A235BCJ5_9BACL|nr:hypothetical protein [Paludifilum halophilum]OYD09677.1 hypothetical protein CHM34_01335 [Paludifilum halophilum]